MSESKFTPGPWYISIDNRSCPSVRNKGGYVCFAPSIHNYGDPLRYMDEAAERQANARLIAAAPDMYEALKWAIDYTKEQLDEGYSFKDKDAPHWGAALAAIAKAEGKND